jgi:hypothetical protein
VYIEGWERGSPEFRRHTELASVGGSNLVQ